MGNRRVHPLKSKYQSSMMYGTLVSTLIAIVFVMCILFFHENRDMVKIDLNSQVEIEFNAIKSSGSDRGGVYPDENPVPGGPVHGYQIQTAGFNKVDRNQITANYTIIDRPDIIEWLEDISGDSGLPGFVQMGGYDPGYDEYLNSPAGPKILRPIDYCPPLGGTGGGVSRNQPLRITFTTHWNSTDMQNYIKTREIADTVIVLMTIDDKGLIINLKTLYDARPDYDFARRFRLGLRNAWIEPAVVNGQKVGGTFPLYCIFSGDETTTFVNNTNDIELVPPVFSR